MKVSILRYPLRRLGCLLLVLSLLLSMLIGSAYASPQPKEDGYVPLSIENDYYTLTVSEEDGHFTLTDRQTGSQIHSYPDGVQEDDSMKRAGRMQVQSALHVVLFDPETQAKTTLYSLPDSVNSGDMTVQRLEKEYVVRYYFASGDVTVPVHYTLDGKRLVVSIIPEEIEEKATSILMSVAIHPYFFSGTSTQDGYLLVPDGSGSLINFNNKKYTTSPYKQKVYGIDLANYRYSKVDYTRSVVMPVFGIGKSDGMVLGVITAGAGDAYIEANPGITQVSYNGAYASFTLMGQDVRVYSEDNRTDVDIYPESRNGVELLQVTYLLRQGTENDYADMAGMYREYLVDTYGLTRVDSDDYPLYLDVYIATMRNKSFLGVPYLGVEKLTTYAQAQNMVEQLQSVGASVSVRLNNWSKQTVRGKVLRSSSLLGSKKELLRLQQTVEKSGMLYMAGNLSEVYQPGLFDRFFLFAENMRNSVINYQEFNLATNLPKDSSHYLLNLPSVEKMSGKFGASLSKLGLNGVSVTGLGNMYTDYSVENSSLTAVEQVYGKAITGLADNGLQVALEGGYQYALGQASLILDLPAGDSLFEICDRAVPFYAIALHGYVPFALEPINAAAEPQKALLQTLETGCGLYFRWMDAQAEKVMYSRNADLYNATSANWMELAKKTYTEYASFMQGKQSLLILDHTYLTDDVVRTVYEDGSYVIINYGNEPYADGATEVAPLSYSTGKGMK